MFYTNSKFAKDNLYEKNVNIKLLGFAAYPLLHKPLAMDKVHDVVVVGHANRLRKSIIRKLQSKFNVGLYGSGWGEGHREVHGQDHVRALNSGKIYLSFAKTAANYINVKVGLFEAMACNTCVVVQAFDEINDYFKPGLEILTYKDTRDLVDLISYYVKNDKMRNWISNNGYEKVIKDHTWAKRLDGVLKDIQKIKNRS